MKVLTIVFYFAILVGVTFSNPQIPNANSGHLCSTCQYLFGEVKKLMPTVKKSTEKQFENTIKETCDKILHVIPLMDKICKQVSENVIEEVCKDLNETEKSVNPNEICSKLKFC
uniref:Saposin B-type domain-containing protein n=1 Tax=Strongyloides venezuelensis TaxID=75913 RepID=A0A0K0FFZ7_STRVS